MGPASHLVHTQNIHVPGIIIYTAAHTHPQTMNRLKILLTEHGINFTDTTFNTEDGIRGLGEQPFVSKIVYVKINMQLLRHNYELISLTHAYTHTPAHTHVHTHSHTHTHTYTHTHMHTHTHDAHTGF